MSEKGDPLACEIMQLIEKPLARAILEQAALRPDDFPEVVVALGKASLAKWAERHGLVFGRIPEVSELLPDLEKQSRPVGQDEAQPHQ